MQSNSTDSDFGTIRVSALLPFELQKRKWQPPPETFTPSLLSAYNKARCAVNVPERLDWVKSVSSARPIPVGLVVSSCKVVSGIQTRRGAGMVERKIGHFRARWWHSRWVLSSQPIVCFGEVNISMFHKTCDISKATVLLSLKNVD